MPDSTTQNCSYGRTLVLSNCLFYKSKTQVLLLNSSTIYCTIDYGRTESTIPQYFMQGMDWNGWILNYDCGRNGCTLKKKTWSFLYFVILSMIMTENEYCLGHISINILAATLSKKKRVGWNCITVFPFAWTFINAVIETILRSLSDACNNLQSFLSEKLAVAL